MRMRVLFLAPPFFGYCKRIAEELDARGMRVDYVNDRPSDSTMFKSIGKLGFGFVQVWIDRYFTKVRDQIEGGSYDLVFVLGGMSYCFTRSQTEELRQVSNARFVLYLWDSLSNCSRIGDSLDLFDTVFSFDPIDCEERSLRFLPLFFSRECGNILPLSDEAYEYDACFIGSVHQICKYKRVKEMTDCLEEAGLRVFKYFYMPSKSAAMLRKASVPEYRDQSYQYLPLSERQVLDIYTRSKTVIDSPQERQSGLTIRTIEALGASRKLVTSNEGVEGYDFFACGNIQICKEGESPDIDFVKSAPKPIPLQIKKRYSLSAWVDSVFEECGLN
ncbi:hypothetical protein ABG957_09335 [Eggerthella lenta]|uniref:hypothetical protein n=1 Tax=Eggerthella lenta TaxID=84112 RepID=UPI001898D049|nr:hypothetical protein [Eggerthella lenta]MDB1807044.1 hypothetical protein [Eggerthella lenta]